MDEVLVFLSTLTLDRIVPTIIILVAGFFIIKSLIKLFDRILERSRLEKSLHAFLHSLMKILLYAILIIIAAGTLGINVTSLVALLSVASLAVSLAVQGTLSNFAGGIQVLSAHPFKVGDYVDISSVQGTVSETGLVYTKLITPDNKVICIPNSEVSSSKIINYSTEENRRVDLVITASYDAPVDEVKDALITAARMVPTVFETPAVVSRVNGYKDSAIEYQLRAWTANETYWDSYYEMMENVKKVFDERGLKMTYPHVNVHIQQ